jgi:hypothetical protein
MGVFLNFAAHPLASHAPGLGAHQISADYPGEVRKIMADNSCWCVFTDGAAGDQFPKNSECGWEAVHSCASGIAVEALRGICDSCRNPSLYPLSEPKIQAYIENVRLKMRNDEKRHPELPVYAGQKEIDAEIQLFTLGEVCLVGVPGEMLAEVGQEIKWHSPFRRTFILYNSTAYLSYLPPANAYVAGGYEVGASFIQPFESLKMVNAAVEGMRKLHAPLPEELDKTE